MRLLLPYLVNGVPISPATQARDVGVIVDSCARRSFANTPLASLLPLSLLFCSHSGSQCVAGVPRLVSLLQIFVP